MNKREKEVIQAQLAQEKKVLHQLERQYKAALSSVNAQIATLQAKEQTTSRQNRIAYQKQVREQLEATIAKLHGETYQTIEQFANDCYKTGYVGTMYDLHGQGLPVITPIDNNAAIKAVMTDTKLKAGVYKELGKDMATLKKRISNELTRGIASGMSYDDIVRNIKMATGAPLSRAKAIVRTEGHRIQQASQEDARQTAKSKGADVVKQWDATLDGNTRDSHRRLDGQIREVDEPFEINGKKAMYPGEFGDPAEDCNCRCVALTRARAALDEEELATMKERAKTFKLDKSKDFADFEAKYLKAAEKEEKKVAPTTIEELQAYGETTLKQHGIQVNVKGAGRYVEAATENIEWLDDMLAEYNSTLKSYNITSGSFSGEGGATIYLTDEASGMRISTASLNPKVKTTLKNIPDEKRALAVTTHEFGHTLTKEELEKDSAFWKEIKSVRTRYRKALKDIEKAEYVTHSITSAEAVERRNGIFISDYANKTLDEFLAESFAQAKLSTNPSPYAVDVLKVVDKYFKKSK